MFMNRRHCPRGGARRPVLGLAACASQKEPAEQALAAVEAKFKESGAEIQKYLPERYAEIEQAHRRRCAMRVASKDYGDVVAGAGHGRRTTSSAPIAEARIERAQVLVGMETEWGEHGEVHAADDRRPWTRRSPRSAAGRPRA